MIILFLRVCIDKRISSRRFVSRQVTKHSDVIEILEAHIKLTNGSTGTAPLLFGARTIRDGYSFEEVVIFTAL